MDTIEINKMHQKEVYRVLKNLQGTTYKYPFGGLEFCCWSEQDVPKPNLSENTYTFVISPQAQRYYDSVRVENLNLEEVLDMVNLIVLKKHKVLWKSYFVNGGIKKDKLN